jgi:hypothetical protein
MQKLTRQERKVHDYIKAHRGCTTRDIQRDTLIECPSARITGLRHKGVLVKEIGTLKYTGARPFVRYAIEEAAPKYRYIPQADGSMLEVAVR